MGLGFYVCRTILGMNEYLSQRRADPYEYPIGLIVKKATPPYAVSLEPREA